MQRADGIVLVDRHICIGCRYCMMACPYGCRSFVHESVKGQKPHTPRGKGTVEACNMCVYRVDNGQLPACVEALTKAGSDAMLFGDLNDPNSDISRAVSKFITQRIREDLGVEPAIHYRGI
jgi:molybdopterin-containing oxidoreductase family iron-sulfur binding subunit